MSLRPPVAVVLLLLLVVVLLPMAGASGASASLPIVAEGARPGPDVLYSAEPAAPQLENRDPRFRAPMLRVSGHEAYVDGEYLYTDHLYDDYGSDSLGVVSGIPGVSRGGALQERAGQITYPTDEARYAGNAADFVELRIAPGADAVAYRFTLNTLLVEDSTIIVLAFDTDGNATTGSATLPRDPGAAFPGTDEVITTWGSGAEHSRLGGEPVTTPVAVSTDLEASQLTVTVPRSVSDPQGTWTATLAVGLHDPATGGWLRPGTQASATQPGGAGPIDPQPTGIFNLGFRFDEAYLGANTPPDTLQAAALRAKEPTRFAHPIDFEALRAGADRTSVPASGTTVRFFPSRLDLGVGRDLDTFPQYRGQLQPYSLYVPSSYRAGTPSPFTLALHSLGQQHWQYNGSAGIQQIGEGRGSLVAASLSRGPDGWYQGAGEYDVFEMWNDVARRFSLDADRVAISGYSMGGYGTYRLGLRYPDLFGAAYTTVGPPGEGVWLPPGAPSGGASTLSNLWLENARNIPFLNLAAGADELVPIVGPRAQNVGSPELGIDGFDQLGYRFRFLVYPAAEHFTIAGLGYDVPLAADFLGEARVDRDPAHVTFAAVPQADDETLGLISDHAYWVSDVVVADAGTPAAPGKGVVDARSKGFGRGAPETASGQGAGVEPLPYVEVNRMWGASPRVPVENVLTIDLRNIDSASIAVARAALDPTEELVVVATADGPTALRFDGAFPPGSAVLRDGEPIPGLTAGAEGVVVPLLIGVQEVRVVAAEEGTATDDPAQPAPDAPPAVRPSTALPATGGGGGAGLLLLLGGAVVATASRHRARGPRVS